MFEREDWTKFRSLNELPRAAGVPLKWLPRLVVKELADNALDTSGNCRVGLLEGKNGFFVEDDGDGIPGDDAAVARLFSINRRLVSSKVMRRPSRGCLGNGLRVVAGAVLASNGLLHVSTRGRRLCLIPDDRTGETRARRVGEYDRPGTRVEVVLGPSLRVTGDALRWAGEAIQLAGGESYTGKTSPHWYDADAFYELLQAAGDRTVREVIEEFHGCAQPNAGRIADGFQGRMARSLDRDEANRLLVSARVAKPIRPEKLGGVGPRADFPGYAKGKATIGLPSAHRGVTADVPVVVEVWARPADKVEARLTINRTPSTLPLKAYQEKYDLEIHGCGLSHTFVMGRRPFLVCINVETPSMPITSEGKAPDLTPFLDIISGLMAKALRAAKNKVRKGGDAARSQKGIVLKHLDEGIADASGEGRHRFSERQLFYSIRPFILEALGVEPNWNYFKKVITDHENAIGQDVPGIYRDSRGTLYHPHTREEIPLGTLAVEQYRRPVWTFNKILYCEKEGLLQILKDIRWPERHDCAFLTSKGYATRAARDVIDLLGATGEELTFYCIHDADGPGTMIYQSLQEATRARPARKVRIVNLGLEPAEARDMELQVEPVLRKKKDRIAVADYVPDEWEEWLQTNRTELNAMNAPEFIAWIDRKFADQVGKLIPPAEVMIERLEEDAWATLEEEIRADILQSAGFEAQVDDAMASLRPTLRAQAETIRDDVESHLCERPEEPWWEPVRLLAETIATDGTEGD